MSLIKTCTNCIFITVHSLLSSIFLYKIFFLKCYAKIQPRGSFNLGSFMRVSTVDLSAEDGGPGGPPILLRISGDAC